MRRLTFILVIGLFLLSGCFWTWGKKAPALPKLTGPIVGSERMQLHDQQTGNTIRVSKISLDRPGFLVIRDDLFGQPGVVVGVSDLLPAGQSTEVSMELTVEQSTSNVYYAMLYLDSGDGIFRQLDDEVITDTQGNPAVVSFTVTETGGEPTDILFPENL